MASSSFTQLKVTDYYRRTRRSRSPSPKRSKPPTGVLRTPTVTRTARVTENPSSLEFPVTYNFLLQCFNSADQVVSIMYNRQELITFTRLQAGVQKTTRRNFGLNQLGQIKTVYPEAYIYEQVRITRQEGILQNRRPDYELTIKPSLNNDLSAYGMRTPVKSPRKHHPVTPTKSPPRTPTKRPYFALSPVRTPPKARIAVLPSDSPSPSRLVPTESAAKLFTGGRLVARSQIFRRNLFCILRHRHKEFLRSLSPPVELNPDEESRLTSWHPKFLLDEEALQIAASELPEPPTVEKVARAKDLLALPVATISSKVEAVAAAVAENQACRDTSVAAEATACSKKTSPSLPKGIPLKLLEKIREKERAKKRLAMLRSPEEETRRLKLSRLPDFVRIINMYFATEGKAVLHLSHVHKKLTDSYASPLGTAEIEDHVKLLRDLVPNWISQTEIADKGAYLRLNRDLDVTDVLKTLEKQ